MRWIQVWGWCHAFWPEIQRVPKFWIDWLPQNLCFTNLTEIPYSRSSDVRTWMRSRPRGTNRRRTAGVTRFRQDPILRMRFCWNLLWNHLVESPRANDKAWFTYGRLVVLFLWRADRFELHPKHQTAGFPKQWKCPLSSGVFHQSFLCMVASFPEWTPSPRWWCPLLERQQIPLHQRKFPPLYESSTEINLRGRPFTNGEQGVIFLSTTKSTAPVLKVYALSAQLSFLVL
jgi:hypothetical protein